MALENEYMLEELTAEEIYQKKLTAGANITINNQNVISATGGGSSVQYTSNYAQGDILGTLNIDGASSAIRTPNLVEGENITITRDQQTGAVTISSTGGSGDLSANELTEEAYNALTPAEKTNGDLYLTHPAALESSEPNKIYYNNTLYGTEGGNDVVELTQAEWDALPSSKLTDGIIYVITDSGGGGGASAISDLTDVELTDLADGEILKYDAIAEKWINTVESKGNNGIHIPPVIFDNDNLKKVNDVDGFPGLEKVFLAPSDYEALTQAEKEDLSKIYYVSEYDYYSDKGGTLVLRVKNDEIKLFVNGFVDENTDLEDGNIVGIINDKIRELVGSYFIGSIAYNENKEPIGGSFPYVYIDANYSRIAFRNASGDSSRVINTTTYAVIDLTNYSQGQGSVLQSNPWEDPYDISGGMTIYYGGKQYSEYEIPDPLPSVTSSDNGKVLKVVNGDWAAGTDIDVLYGEERPDDENDGKDKDFYLKVKSNSDILAEEDVVLNSTTAHPMALLDFINDEGIYSFTVQGNPSGNGAGETADFPFHNLIEGEKYQATFTVSFDSNTLFKENVPNYAYFCGKYITLVDTTEATTYTTEFTCPTNPFLSLRFYRLRDGVTFNCHITNLTIKSYRIEEIYNKHDKYWRKYIPPQMVGAAETTDGQSGTVPAPTRGSVNYFLKGDGTWGLDTLENLRGVAFSEPLTNGQILKYNARMKCWENASENGSNLILDAQIYSTDEKQVGVWIDGKPLYQKTINITDFSSGEHSLISDASNIDKLVDWKGNFHRASKRWGKMENRSENNTYSQYGFRVDLNDGNPKALMYTIYTYSDLDDGSITIWYTKTTDSAGSGGYQAYGFSPIIYSEEERVVGVGKNNKPLYQKTIMSELIPADAVSSDILTNIDECHVVDIKTYNSDNTIAFIPLSISMYNYQGIGTNYGYVYYDVTNHSVKFVNQSRKNSIYIEATIQYTKTTDVAGSGSYNTLGAPMTHIDGSEQVVGTLFGETLYQKSYQTTITIASTARAWYTLVTSSQLRVINADKVLIDATHSFIKLNDSIINLNYSSIVNAAGGTAGCSYSSPEDEVQVCLYGFTAGTYPITITIQYTKSTS